MPRDIAAWAARGQRRGRPELPGLLVAQVDRLATAVRYRIVVPGRQAEFVCVFAPGVGAARFRNDGAEMRVGDHVDPGRGRCLPRRQANHVLAAICGESAQVVAKDHALAQFGLLFGFGNDCHLAAWRTKLERTWQGYFQGPTTDLVGQRALVVAQDHARDRLHQDAVFA